MRVTVFRDHISPERAPIRVSVDDEVVVMRRDNEWPAFVFVTTDSGEGWVPSRYLASDHGPTSVLVAYDTTELCVTAGDIVGVIERDDESGWWWCRNDAGEEGWVPAANFGASEG